MRGAERTRCRSSGCGPPGSRTGSRPRSGIGWLAVALGVLSAAATASGGEVRSDGRRAGKGFSYIPPGIEDRVVYYHSFESGLRSPEINLLDAQVISGPEEPAPGLASRGLRMSGRGGALKLTSGALTLARPVTVMMWWRLEAPMKEDTGYHLVTLGGKGIVSAFVRGKGEWCALREPTFVFQVYYFEGIRNMNHVWSGSAWVESNSWHHFAMTVSGAAEVRTYWDGHLRVQHTIKGRQFGTGDVGSIELGSSSATHPMTIDEVLILDRALADGEIADYCQATGNLARVGFPVSALGPPAREEAAPPGSRR